MKIIVENLEEKSILELVTLKEEFRAKHNLYIENDLGERGSKNRKTKEYYGVSFKKRIRAAKGKKYLCQSCHQTFDTYREALIYSLYHAQEVSDRFDFHDIMNAYNPV